MLHTDLNPLRSERLILRFPCKEDVLGLNKLRNNDEINKFLNRKPSDIDETFAFIDRITNNIQSENSFFWLLIFPEQDKLIGTICLWNFNEEKTVAEVGYELHPDFQGKGIIHEAIQPVIKLGFEHFGLKMISGWTNSKNQKSINVLERNGFKRNIEEEEKISETYPEMVIYSLLHSLYEY